MKKLIIAGVIIFFLLIGNTMVAQTCQSQGEIPYKSAERQFEFVKNQTNDLNFLNHIDSSDEKQQLSQVTSHQIQKILEDFQVILSNYKQVPACSSYYMDTDGKIPKVENYIEQLNQIVN